MSRVYFDEFVRRAKRVHGEKYEYLRDSYVNMKTAVTIVCPVHGRFEQRPGHHIDNHGCRRCHRKGKLDTAEFIRRSREVHGDYYDYSNAVYTGALKKLTVGCPNHGPFQVTANKHMSGISCRQCSYEHRRKSVDEFIAKAQVLHGAFYKYDTASYVKDRVKMNIICPVHGSFRQTPNGHLQGKGCMKCGHERQRVSLEQFKERAKAVHGDAYSYDKVVITRAIDENVIIGCPTHGVFSQSAINHLRGFGCAKCSFGAMRLTFEEFVSKSRKTHGNRYQYHREMFTKRTDYAGIECNTHGIFWQNAHNHIVGRGCPKCSQSSGEKIVMGALTDAGLPCETEANLFARYYFDFNLPEHKVLIEFDGQQHFYPVNFGRNDEEYKQKNLWNTKRRDREKNTFAVKNGYVLYRIPYYVPPASACQTIIREIETGKTHNALSNGAVKVFLPTKDETMVMYETVLRSDLITDISAA